MDVEKLSKLLELLGSINKLFGYEYHPSIYHRYRFYYYQKSIDVELFDTIEQNLILEYRFVKEEECIDFLNDKFFYQLRKCKIKKLLNEK